ncbi:MAG: hypothetical protein NUW02_03635 [Candidatus Campbellbacteria bacterium]|nr:hypothetical protein [Candidatus Campbellbacteria bacterium]
MKPLLLYVNPTFQREEARVSPLMYPFWGDSSHKTVSFGGAFSQHQFDTSYYNVTDNPDMCDCHFLPFNFWGLQKKNPTRISETVACAKQHNKPLLIDAFGDTMRPIDIPNSIVLRFAQYRRLLTDRDIIIPAYIEDLLESSQNNVLTLRTKGAIPSIGFVGWASLSVGKHLRTYIKEGFIRARSLVFLKDGVFRKGIFLRREVLKKLSHSGGISTVFQTRSSYSGNTRTVEDDPAILRKEFIDNIVGTDYALCVKGDANQSTRFYEALSLGRIPLVLDTECVFPLENKINYRAFCLFVDYADRYTTAERVSAFHTEISQDSFQEMQKRARATFETYLRIDSFTPFLVEEIRKRL